MNKTSFHNITNYNNISLLNISNSTHNNNYFNSRFKNHHIWVFFFFIAIFFIPFLTPLICLTIELFNEFYLYIYNLIFKRLNRKKIIIEMGTLEHKMNNQ